jgi:hypothetical protein
MALAISSWVWANQQKPVEAIAVKDNAITQVRKVNRLLGFDTNLWLLTVCERFQCLVIYTP